MKDLAKKFYDKEIYIELLNKTLKSMNDFDVPDPKPITDFSFLEDFITTIDSKLMYYVQILKYFNA
jgi:hypothetical protein